MEIFRSITPLVEPLSLDEAFLDVVRRGAPARPPGRDRPADPRPGRRRAGHHLLGRASRSTKFVAKLASSRAKPDGLLVVPAAEVVAFLHPLPVGALWGVGEKTEEELHPARAAHRRRHRAHPGRTPCVRALGQAAGAAPARAVLGSRRAPASCRTSRTRASAPRRPSPATSTTPTSSAASCCGCAERTAGRLRSAGLAGRTVTHQGAVRRLHHDHPGPDPARAHRRRRRALRHRARSCTTRSACDRARIRLVGVRVEGWSSPSGAPPAAARRARPRLARGRAGRRPGGPPVRRGRGPAGQPGRPATTRRARRRPEPARPRRAALERPTSSPHRRAEPIGCPPSGDPASSTLGRHRFHSPGFTGASGRISLAYALARSRRCIGECPRGGVRAALRARAATARADGAGALRRGPEVRVLAARQGPPQQLPPPGPARRRRLRRRRRPADDRPGRPGRSWSACSASCSCWRRRSSRSPATAPSTTAAQLGVVDPSGVRRPPQRAGAGSGRHAASPSSGGFMARMEERWNRRRDENGRSDI